MRKKPHSEPISPRAGDRILQPMGWKSQARLD
jgi:hypothetical protein